MTDAFLESVKAQLAEAEAELAALRARHEKLREGLREITRRPFAIEVNWHLGPGEPPKKLVWIERKELNALLEDE